MIARLREQSAGEPSSALLEGIFGSRRRLYKRLVSFSFIENPDVFARLAQQPYPRLIECSKRLAHQLAEKTQQAVADWQVLFDAPPVGLEVQFDIDVIDSKTSQSRKLGDISPVVQTLAQEQFDNYVKQVRVFVAPELVDATKSLPESEIHEMVNAAIR